jgi:hypothetical protein
MKSNGSSSFFRRKGSVVPFLPSAQQEVIQQRRVEIVGIVK